MARNKYKQLIVQHNSITQSRHRMSATEMNIMFLLLAKLNNDDPPNKMYHISVSDMEKTCDKNVDHLQFKEACYNLRQRTYDIRTEDGGWLIVGVLASVEYLRGKGIIELELSQKIRPYLFDLKNNFTTFQLNMALRVKSKYSKRLYQMLSQFRSTGKFYTSIEDLKMKFGLIDEETGEEQYKKFGLFKKFVLEVAKTELKENTDICFTYKTRKTGRKITHLEFDITNQSVQQRIEFEEQKDQLPPRSYAEEVPQLLYHADEPRDDGRKPLYIRMRKVFCLSHWQIKRIFEAFEYKEITRILYEINLLIVNNEVSNIGGFTASCFENAKPIGIFNKILPN